MPFTKHIHIHDFFHNKELNHFYIAVAIMTFGESLISIFVPIYLYTLGYQVYSIIFFFFLKNIFDVLSVYHGAKIVAKIGSKHAILLSSIPIVIYYFGLNLLPAHPWLFFVLPLLIAWRAILYNLGYSLNYISHSDRTMRGKELSFIGILSVGMSVVAPLIGGLIAGFSFTALYITGSLLVIAGTFPLFLTADRHEQIKFSCKDMMKGIFSKKQKGTMISFAGYAIESAIGMNIWPVFLIIVLASTEKTGFIVTVSMMLSILVFYFVGRMTDKHNKIKLLRFGTLLYFFAWVGRIFADSSFRILVVDSYKNIAQKVVQIPWSAQIMDLAMKRGYFRFFVVRELMFNLSRAVVIPFIILIFLYTNHPFIIVFSIAAFFSLGYMFLDKITVENK